MSSQLYRFEMSGVSVAMGTTVRTVRLSQFLTILRADCLGDCRSFPCRFHYLTPAPIAATKAPSCSRPHGSLGVSHIHTSFHSHPSCPDPSHEREGPHDPDEVANQSRASSLCLLLPDWSPSSGLMWEVVGRLVADMVREKAGRLGIMVT